MSRAADAEYSIYILEYARVLEFPIGIALHGRANAGTMAFPYSYGLVRSDEHTILVDCGYDDAEMGRALATSYGVSGWQSPEAVLSKVGVHPNDVDMIVLTHLHFDHAGNTEAFPKAHVYIQEEEIKKFMWSASLPRRLKWLTNAFDPDDMLTLAKRLFARSLTLVDGDRQLLPGVNVVAAHDTHTLGSQYVLVDDGRGERFCFAGDNVYVWENLEGESDSGEFIPIGLVNGSTAKVLLAMEDMYQAVGGKTTNVLPVHDHHLWERFPSRLYDDGLHVAEVSRRAADKSILD